jgi:phosphatidylinositol-3-phosphatase
MRHRKLIAAVCTAATAVTTLAMALTPAGAPAAAFKLPPVRHVFVIMLENENYATTFGDPSAAPYLASTLPKDGALLSDYYATGHESNDNYISIVSGQPPNPQNQADCQIFDDFVGAVLLSNGVESGTGCVYPSDVPNVGTQLSTAGLNWKAYEEDMGERPQPRPRADTPL